MGNFQRLMAEFQQILRESSKTFAKVFANVSETRGNVAQTRRNTPKCRANTSKCLGNVREMFRKKLRSECRQTIVRERNLSLFGLRRRFCSNRTKCSAALQPIGRYVPTIWR